MAAVGTVNLARSPHAGAWLALVLYVAFLGTAPYVHHDFACHQISTSHCASCSASLPGSEAQHGIAVSDTRLPEAGSLTGRCGQKTDTLLAAATTGRAPPSGTL